MKTQKNQLNKKLTVIIIGYDAYKDVWDHDFALMNRFWKDRPRTILVNNSLNPKYDGIEVINAGDDAEWSKKVIFALKAVETKYVLLLLEDFFITKEVNDEALLTLINKMELNHLDFCQILVQAICQSWIKGKVYDNEKHHIVIPSDKKYPLNLQAAIWRKEYLADILGEGNYNAWKFEMDHMEDRVNENRITCIIDTSNLLNITHGIVQSKYLRSAKKKLNDLGCIITDRERETLSFLENLKYNFKLLMYSLIPSKLEKQAKKIGKFIKIDFVTDRLKNEK